MSDDPKKPADLTEAEAEQLNATLLRLENEIAELKQLVHRLSERFRTHEIYHRLCDHR